MAGNVVSRSAVFVDKANSLRVSFDVDGCVGRIMEVPVMFTPAILGAGIVSVAFGAGVWIGMANAR